MGLIEKSSSERQIIINLLPIEVNGTKIHRQSIVEDQAYSPQYAYVKVSLLIQMFEYIDANTKGRYLGAMDALRDYRIELLAGINDFVDPITGDFIGTRVEYEDPINSAAPVYDIDGVTIITPAGKFYGIDFIPEFDYLDNKAKTENIVLSQLIEYYVAKSDANGKTGNKVPQ